MAQTLPQRGSDTSGEVSGRESSRAGSRCPRLLARRTLRRPCRSDAQQLFRRRAFRRCTWLRHRICDRRPLRSRARPLHSRTRRLSRRCARHASRNRVRRAFRICARRLFRRRTWLRHRICDRHPSCSRSRPLHSRMRPLSRRLAQQSFRSPARRPLRWPRGVLRATAMAAPSTRTRPRLRPIELQPSKSPPRDETTCRGRLPITSSQTQANTVKADAYSAPLPLKTLGRCSDERPSCTALR